MSDPSGVTTRAAGRSPLVLDSPHSGTEYPDDFDHAAAARYRAPGRGQHVDALYARGADARRDADRGAFPAQPTSTRTVARSTSMPIAPADAWPDPITPVAQDRSSASASSGGSRDGGVPMYARKLSSGRGAASHRRVSYQPYQRVRRRTRSTSAHAHFGAVWHINCHSMPAVGDAMSEDPGHAARGFRARRSRRHRPASRNSPRFVRGTLRGLGYDVAINDPVQGRGAGAHARRPAEHATACRSRSIGALYMDEATLARQRRFRYAAARTRATARGAAPIRSRSTVVAPEHSPGDIGQAT